MFDAKHLLGTLLGTGMGGMNRRSGFPGAGSRGRHAAEEGGGGLGEILHSVGRLSGGGAGSGLATLGGLAGLLGVGGRLGKGAGLAALGGLALHALKNYQEKQGEPQGEELPEKATDAIGDEEAVVIIRAMVAAANADGRIDAEEEQRILGQLEQSGASEEERNFLARELRNPTGMDEIAKAVRTPELAQQVYGASLVAVTADTPAEQSYLRYLADRIGLDAQMTASIHQQLGVASLGR